MNNSSETLLKVENLSKHFPITKGVFRRQVGTVKAVDGISFEIKERERVNATEIRSESIFIRAE